MSSGPRYNRKPDGNQSAILKQAAKVNALKLFPMDKHPGIGYDVVGRYQDGPPQMIEIKAGPRDPLTDSEKAARRYYGDYWHRVETFDDLLAAFGISTERAPDTW